MDLVPSCFLCEKHAGKKASPPGGYIYEDEFWLVCHFPANQSSLGHLVIESKRHFLDFSEMTDDEAHTYGILAKKLYAVLKELTNAERVYSFVMLEGVPHFHAHFLPRESESETKGFTFVTEQKSCDEGDVVFLASKMHEILSSG